MQEPAIIINAKNTTTVFTLADAIGTGCCANQKFRLKSGFRLNIVGRDYRD
jgi:hypothetical protein